MIEIYRKSGKDSHIQQVNVVQKGSWIHVVDPTASDIDFLVDDLNLEHGHITDALDPFEAPRFESEDNAKYLFLRIPYEEDGAIKTMPVLLVVADDFIVTIMRQRERVFDDFFSGKIDFTTTEKEQFLLLMLIKVNVAYQNFLQGINKDIREMTERMEDVEESDVVGFLETDRVVNELLAALTGMSSMYRTILNEKHLALTKEDTDVIEDLVLSNEEMMIICAAVLRSMVHIRETYVILVAEQTHESIRSLRRTVIVLAVPILVAAVLGINARIPFQDRPLSFVVGVGIVAAVFLITVVLTGRKEQ